MCPFYKDLRVWKECNYVPDEQSVHPDASAELPSQDELIEQVASFKKTLQPTAQQI